jgi:acyl carrier protein phosphodiesterase
MNYLAHAWLSFGHPDVLVGNMISDYVKGKARYDYPPGIQAGIGLHRRIDEFTDTHPATADAKQFFRPAYRLYSGAVVDVIYDHFLANDPAAFNDSSLYDFSQEVYVALEAQVEWLPAGFAALLPYMKEHNWLYNYRLHTGIARSLKGVARRAAYMPPADEAIRLLDAHYDDLNECYRRFSPAVKDFAKMELSRILT